MPKFNHAVSIAFSVISDDPEGEDFTPAMLKAALEARIRDLDNSPKQSEWIEAIGAPFDSYEEETPQPSMPKFKVFLQQYVERVAIVEVEASDAGMAAAIAKTDLASSATWEDGDHARFLDVYKIQDAAGQTVWER